MREVSIAPYYGEERTNLSSMVECLTSPSNKPTA